MKPEALHVLTAITNPVRYRSRLRLFHEFRDRVLASGAHLHVGEAAFGDRAHEVPDTPHPRLRITRFRTSHELWHKENILNQLIRGLPPQATYIAWLDADITFLRDDWAVETVQQLQHFQWVQMFSHVTDLGPNHETIQSHVGFGYAHWHGLPAKHGMSYAASWHPGFAWAARRAAIETVGGLLDWAVLGSADFHMAMALIGRIEESFPTGMNRHKVHPAYLDELRLWQERAQHLARNVGYVPGTILHHWHGKKKDRRYIERWHGLVRHGFDPRRHLVRGLDGLYRLTPAAPIGLRDYIRRYFRARHEDSIDL